MALLLQGLQALFKFKPMVGWLIQTVMVLYPSFHRPYCSLCFSLRLSWPFYSSREESKALANEDYLWFAFLRFARQQSTTRHTSKAWLTIDKYLMSLSAKELHHCCVYEIAMIDTRLYSFWICRSSASLLQFKPSSP